MPLYPIQDEHGSFLFPQFLLLPFHSLVVFVQLPAVPEIPIHVIGQCADASADHKWSPYVLLKFLVTKGERYSCTNADYSCY